MPNLAALRAAIFLLSAKNRWGGTYVPPPAVRGLMMSDLISATEPTLSDVAKPSHGCRSAEVKVRSPKVTEMKSNIGACDACFLVHFGQRVHWWYRLSRPIPFLTCSKGQVKSGQGQGRTPGNSRTCGDSETGEVTLERPRPNTPEL